MLGLLLSGLAATGSYKEVNIFSMYNLYIYYFLPDRLSEKDDLIKEQDCAI